MPARLRWLLRVMLPTRAAGDAPADRYGADVRTTASVRAVRHPIHGNKKRHSYSRSAIPPATDARNEPAVKPANSPGQAAAVDLGDETAGPCANSGSWMPARRC